MSNISTRKEMDFYLLQGMKNNSFYILHKFLFEKDFIELSNNSKILYTLIKDRMNLSILNKWHDNNGKVYCYFTNEDIKKLLNVSGKTATNAKKELIDMGLLEEERQYDKPTRYYLKKPAKSITNTKTGNSYGSEMGESTAPKWEKVRPNKKELSNKESNKKEYYTVAKATEKVKEFVKIYEETFNIPYRKITIDGFTHDDIISLDIYDFSIRVNEFFKLMGYDKNKCTLEYINKTFNRLL